MASNNASVRAESSTEADCIARSLEEGAHRQARCVRWIKKSGRFFWVKRGDSARCRNGDLVICRNARLIIEVTGSQKKSLFFI